MTTGLFGDRELSPKPPERRRRPLRVVVQGGIWQLRKEDAERDGTTGELSRNGARLKINHLHGTNSSPGNGYCISTSKLYTRHINKYRPQSTILSWKFFYTSSDLLHFMKWQLKESDLYRITNILWLSIYTSMKPFLLSTLERLRSKTF